MATTAQDGFLSVGLCRCVELKARFEVWRNLMGKMSIVLVGVLLVGMILPAQTVEDSSDAPFTILQREGYDFSSDGKDDILWNRSDNNRLLTWVMNGNAIQSYLPMPTVTNMDWHCQGVADFNFDDKLDLLWWNSSNGRLLIWYMDGNTISGYKTLAAFSNAEWRFESLGDYNQDGYADLFWHNTSTGKTSIWLTENGVISGYRSLGNWSADLWVIDNADFDKDGQTDLVVYNSTNGSVRIYRLAQAAGVLSVAQQVGVGAVVDLQWVPQYSADVNQDGKYDVVWRNNSSGKNLAWIMNGTSLASFLSIPAVSDLNWKMKN